MMVMVTTMIMNMMVILKEAYLFPCLTPFEMIS